MWHVGLGVPWTWRLGPSNASERDHVREMVNHVDFPENTLFIGDAGFVGYDLWQTILDQGQDFLVRVGGNVRLIQKLGYYTEQGRNGIVYCWPGAAVRKKLPPLTIRLVKCKVENQSIYLVTSVLDEDQLNRKQMVKLYRLRWGIELEFRALKQIFDRGKLRCRTSDRAIVELEWSIMGMAIIELFALREQISPRKKFDPAQISFAKSLRAVRRCLAHLSGHPRNNSDLATSLAQALIDKYKRASCKTARYHPTRKTPPSCGPPVVTKATAEQRRKLSQIQFKTAI